MRSIVLIVALLTMTGCQQESDVTGSTSNKCMADFFPGYNPASLNQCLAACSKCGHGTTATCSMSCKLKGAG
jgi:hypothetical protein